MTFYEAALRVLEAEGHPLHFSAITEKSIQQSLLSHVGKTPEQTMLSRLAAMARRTRDRKVIVTAKDTFALADWLLPEDPEALAQTGVPEPNPEADLPPLRPAERHPDPRNDNVRAAGRVDRDRKRGRRDEEDDGHRRRRYPPIPEVAFEILSETPDGMKAEQLAAAAREKELGSNELGERKILSALFDDNQRRIDAGRRPQFVLDPQTQVLTLERASAPSDTPVAQLQAAFTAALGTARAEPLAVGEDLSAEAAVVAQVKAGIKDARRAVARILRRKLSELDTGTFEKAVVKMLHGVGFRELKVAKRSKEGPLLTARRREGSIELRFAVRMLKGNAPVDRRVVQELRRDLGHYSSQVGLVTSAGELRSDAKAEAQVPGPLVMLWCGDALGEKFIDGEAGVSATQLQLYEVDDRFFETARVEAEESARRREERQQQRGQGGAGPGEPGGSAEGEGGSLDSARDEGRAARDEGRAARDEGRAARDEGRAARDEGRAARDEGRPAQDELSEGRDEGEDGDEGDDEGDEEVSSEQDAAPGAPRASGAPGTEGQPPGQGDRKRRRRRRRGRRGRGNRPEGAPGQPGAPGAQATAPGQSEPAAESPAPPPPPPSGDGGGPT